MSDGLAAVYRFEYQLDATTAAQTGGRLSYVGLSGGFGTVSVGKVDNASQNHFGGLVDNSNFLGGTEGIASNKVGNTISYAASVGAMSFQVDAIADRDDAKSKADEDLDSSQVGASLRLGDNAKIGVAYVSHPVMKADMPKKNDKQEWGMEHLDDDNAAMIAGTYSIGGMTMHLGYGEREWDTDSKITGIKDDGGGFTLSANTAVSAAYDSGLEPEALLDQKQKTSFFGVAGGLGDTGVSFFLQVKNNKTTTNTVGSSYADDHEAYGAIENAAEQEAWLKENGYTTAPAQEPGNRADSVYASDASDSERLEHDFARSSEKSTAKNTPFTIGVSRSLGGGASIHLEHNSKDEDNTKNETALVLQVDF